MSMKFMYIKIKATSILLFLNLYIQAQTTTVAPIPPTTSVVFGGRAHYTTWNIGVNAGVLAPVIPYGSNDFTNKELNFGYGASIRKQLGHAFGLQLDYVGGKLSGSNVNAVGGVKYGARAFDTQLAYSSTLSGVVNVATVDFIRRKNSVNFFVSAGGGLAGYAPKVTLASNQVVDFKNNAASGHTYVHELVIPVGAGVKFRLSDKVALNLGYTATFVDGDNLDGTKGGFPTKDKFSYGYGGLEFALGSKSKPNLDWVNPAAMMYDELKDSTLRITVDSLKGKVSGVETSIADLKKDSDGDGVRDDLDKCPGTPAGTVVDGSGCELKFPAPVAPVVVAPPAPPAPVVVKKTVTKKYRVRTKKYHTVLKNERDTSGSSSRAKLDFVKILYGTDRKVIRKTNAGIEYGGEASDIGEKYKVGYTIVTIPPNHTPGITERPNIFKLEFKEDSTKHMIQKTTVQLNDEAFNQLLKNSLNGSDAFIFIHGYNNTFHDAALRTAQLAYDINLHIEPIMFSWSSNGKILSYLKDAENVRAAIPAFEDFIKRVATLGKFKRIHLIAHSMGNRLVTEALFNFRNDTTNLKIDQIIMAAPDVDARLFKRDFAPAMVKKSKKITVYSAKNDWALLTSQKISGHLRLGAVKWPPYALEKVDIIDAEEVKTDFLGHGRFAESQAIMTDINKLFITGLDPILRGVPHLTINNRTYFYLKKWASN